MEFLDFLSDFLVYEEEKKDIKTKEQERGLSPV